MNCSVEVHNGFRVLERVERMDIQQAGAILRTKRQRRYTCALRVGLEAILTRHVIVCPACGRQAPAHRGVGVDWCLDWKRIPRNVIDKWADPQTSLFDDEGLSFRDLPDVKAYHCNCGFISRLADQMDVVGLRSDDRRIVLTCDRTELGNLFSFPDLTEKTLPLPLSEELTFDMERGEAILRVLGSEGECVGELNLMESMKGFIGSTASEVLRVSCPLRRKLLQAFSAVWGAPVPFDKQGVSAEDFVAMTLFHGYPRSFYDAIPYSTINGALHESFRDIAGKLRNAADLPKVYEASVLPKTKAIKRLFYASPGLFFYLKEAEFLWQITSDRNVFERRIMGLPNIYEVLSLLHRYPRTKAFFEDYAQAKGASGLAARLEHRWHEEAKLVALQYAAMDEDTRAKERAVWKRLALLQWAGTPYSLPMRPGSDRIRNCTIDGYSFVWLRTRSDYRKAGHRMGNCLTQWESSCNPVIVVKKDGEYCAAIEMEGNEVVQARAQRNYSVRQDAKLYQAFCKWLKRYSLEKPICLELEEMGELLF